MQTCTVEIYLMRSPAKPWLYLLTLFTGLRGLHEGPTYPQAWAVVDDFGNLVVVSAWS